MTYDEFEKLPTIDSQFPCVFESGARWTDMAGECNDCHRKLSGDVLRGTVSRPFNRAFQMEGYGYCCVCNLLTTFSYRLYPDMSLVGRSPQTGEWTTWKFRSPTFIEKVRAWIGL